MTKKDTKNNKYTYLLSLLSGVAIINVPFNNIAGKIINAMSLLSCHIYCINKKHKNIKNKPIFIVILSHLLFEKASI
jgi:hypothetical protein